MTDAGSADTINEAIDQEPVPIMPDQNPTHVKLLRGIREETDDGIVWHTEAEVRELTGADEEALAAIERKSVMYTEYMNALLSRAVVRIGGLSAINEGVINKLILQDRESLFLAILKVTYGQTRELHTLCAACNTLNTITIDIDEDFGFDEPDFDVREGLYVENRGKKYHLRLPNGEDTIYAQKDTDNDAAYNTKLLSRVVVFDGEEPANREEWAKNLNVSDRKKLINTLLDMEIGPRLEGVDTHCAECDVEMNVLLDWVSLLLG